MAFAFSSPFGAGKSVTILSNTSSTFSPDLVDFSIYIIDVAQGEKIPRKAGQGMIKSDLFIINKIDLAPYVGANLDVMREDTLALCTNFICDSM